MNKKHERSFLIVIYAIVLAVLAIFIIKAINSSSKPTTKHSTKPIVSHAKNRPSESSNNSNNSFKSSSTAVAKASDNLSNTGPGDTIGIFAASNLVFGLLYYLSCYVRLSRKQ